MINQFKPIACGLTLLFLISCSNILQTVELKGFLDEKKTSTEGQNTFDVDLKPLTLSEAKRANLTPYRRKVIVSGSGVEANVYTEASLLKKKLPPELNYKEYVLGVGDQLTFVQLQDPKLNNDKIFSESIKSDTGDNLLMTEGRVGSDGSVLLLGIGRLDAGGRTINELRSEVRNILIRNGLAPIFQLEITDFLSRKAFIFGAGINDGVVPITQRPLSLKELAATSGYSVDLNSVNLVTLKRGNKLYRLSSGDLFDESRAEIFIQDKDHIELAAYPYKPGKVYSVRGGGTAEITNINPAVRETMADVLYKENGPLYNQQSKFSEVYLLRGYNPVTAYHLDAQSASRILVAEAIELRPSDIIFIPERSITSFNRLLSELNPLNGLLEKLNVIGSR